MVQQPNYNYVKEKTGGRLDCSCKDLYNEFVEELTPVGLKGLNRKLYWVHGKSTIADKSETLTKHNYVPKSLTINLNKDSREQLSSIIAPYDRGISAEIGKKEYTKLYVENITRKKRIFQLFDGDKMLTSFDRRSFKNTPKIVRAILREYKKT